MSAQDPKPGIYNRDSATYRLRVSGNEGRLERRGLQAVYEGVIALCEAYGGCRTIQLLPAMDINGIKDGFYLVDLREPARLPLAATVLGVGTYGGALLIPVERIDDLPSDD
jgi:hypothetical protein